MKRKRKRPLHNHVPASEVVHRIGRESFDRYFVFTIKRNPWDAVLSFYFWKHRTQPRPSLGEFIRSDGVTKRLAQNGSIYRLDGEVVADRICRFESLAEDLDEVRQHVGLPEASSASLEESYRTDRRPYRELLGDDEAREIARLFAREVDLMGYEF